MYYYAMIDSSNIVTNTISSASTITAPTMIPISEEQFNSGDLIGKYYDSSTGEFVDPTPSVLAELSTEQINHGEEWLSDIINRLYKKVPKVHTPNSFTEIENHGMESRIYDIAYGNGIYVFQCGRNVYTSSDLVSFTRREIGTTDYIRKMLFHEGYFFVTTRIGEIMKSSDGITWTKNTITLDTDDEIGWHLVAIPGKIATITNKGKVYASSDAGETWENVYTSTAECSAVTYLGKEFVLLEINGNSDEGYTITKKTTVNNGMTWESTGNTLSYDGPILLDKIVSNGEYLVVTYSGSMIYTSIDGLVWELEKTTFGDAPSAYAFFVGNVVYVTNRFGCILYNDMKYIHKWNKLKLENVSSIDVACECNGKFIVVDILCKVMIDDAFETKLVSEV